MTLLNFIRSGSRVLSTAPRYLLLILIISSSSYASDTTSGKWQQVSPYLECPTTHGLGHYYDNSQDACDACAAEINASRGDSLTCLGPQASSFQNVVHGCGGFTAGGTPCGAGTFNVVMICPNILGATAIGIDAPTNTCTYDQDICPTGETYNVTTEQCEVSGPPSTCTAGETANGTGPAELPLGSSTQKTICRADDCEQTWTPIVETVGYVYYETVTTGNPCTFEDIPDNFSPETQPTNLPDPIPDPAPSNGCLSGSDGSVHCSDDQVNSPPLPDNGTASVPAQPDAVQTDPATGDTYNTFNNSTTNNSTNFTGTTPTTGQTGDGASTGLGGIDQDGDGEGDCNPAIEDCGASNTGGGLTCDSPPTCEGDAIQCAIRFQAWSTRCNLESTIEDVTEAEVMQELGQTQTIEEYFNPENNPDNEIDINSEVTLPTAGAGACPADLDISLSFGSLSFPSQPICDIATIVRPAILALAYLISGLMFYNGLVRDF